MQNGRKSEKEKMLAGELYLAADEELTGERDLARKLLWAYNQSRPGNMEKRDEILKRLIKARGRSISSRPFTVIMDTISKLEKTFTPISTVLFSM